MVEIGNDDENVTKVVKILILGNMGTGKTAFVKRFSEGVFSEFYKSTIGADFAYRKLDWDSNVEIGVQLCDISGQDRFYKTSRVFYQSSVAAVIAFDLTFPNLEIVEYWKKDLEEKVFTSTGETIPILLIGTKSDLLHDDKWGMTPEEIEKYWKDNKYIGFFTTSSRYGINVDESIKYIIKHVLDNNIEPASVNDNVDNIVDLNEKDDVKKEKQCC